MTQQHFALLLFRFAQRAGKIIAIIHFTADDGRFAGTTGAATAAVGQADMIAQRGLEHGFAVFDGKSMITGLQRDLSNHIFILHSCKEY